MTYIFAMLLTAYSVVWASPAEESETRRIAILDRAESLLSNEANGVANRLDTFFADQRADDELGRSVVRLRTIYDMRERATGNFRYQTRFNLKLPKAQQKLEEKFFKRKRKEKRAGTVIRGFSLPRDPNEVLNTKWQFHADAGVNVSLSPRVFTRGRLRKNFYIGKFVNRFVEEVSWHSDRQWINIASITSDKDISDNMLFRFINEVRWEITHHTGSSTHGPSIIQQISDDDALSYNMRAINQAIGNTIFFDNFQLSTTYRRDLYHSMLYFDVTPGLDFPKHWNFRRNPFILFQLELLLGRG